MHSPQNSYNFHAFHPLGLFLSPTWSLPSAWPNRTPPKPSSRLHPQFLTNCLRPHWPSAALIAEDSWTKQPNITATHKVLQSSVILSEFESCVSLRLKPLKAEALPGTTCMISQSSSPHSYVVLKSLEELRSKFVHLWLKHNLDVKPFFHHHHNLTIPKFGGQQWRCQGLSENGDHFLCLI